MASVLRRATAGWLVAVFLLAAAVPLADTRHALFDDVLCADPAQPSGQAARFRAASDAGPADHCAVCHLQRAVRHATLASAVVVSSLDASTPGHTRSSLRPILTFVRHSSSRAPPTAQVL